MPAAQHLLHLIARDGQVLPGADPGLQHVTEPRVLERIGEIAHGAGLTEHGNQLRQQRRDQTTASGLTRLTLSERSTERAADLIEQAHGESST